MSQQVEHKEGVTRRISDSIEKGIVEDNLPLHSRFCQGLPRQKVHLPGYGIHPWQRDVRCHQIGKIDEHRND